MGRAPELRIYDNELIVDNFAGGGGASLGMEMALGRSPDIAINHDPEAIAMHKANHPNTKHYCENVWDVDPLEACAGRPVGLAWFSPDCKHFSKAKGGKPVDKEIRGLAWVAIKWARLIKPRVIILENVEEFQTWGPLKKQANGKSYPDPTKKGLTFRRWIKQLENCGYKVEWKEMKACDYGAPTIRKRLFLIARSDGLPIAWPAPSHGKGRQAYRTAAECIDWDIPCPSIFSRKRPLADNTLRRIARGIQRYVLDSSDPFIVPLTHQGDARTYPLNEPLRTITGAKRGEQALVTPYLARIGQTGGNGKYVNSIDEPITTITSKNEHLLISPTLIQTGYGERKGQKARAPGLDKPLGTVVAGGIKHALVTAFMAKHYGGHETPGSSLKKPIGTITTQDHNALVVTAFMAQHNSDKNGRARAGRSIKAPLSTIVHRGTQQQIVTSNLIKLYGTCKDGQPVTQPMPTIRAGGTHVGEVRAFLTRYYGEGGQLADLKEPMRTVRTKDCLALVTVEGVDYAIADIGMRMLTPKELYRAQGFGDRYQIEVDDKGKPFTKTAQVRMCGNSVSPPNATAVVRANFPLIEEGALVA